VHRRRARIRIERGADDEARLRRLLDAAEVLDEREPPEALEDPADGGRLLVGRQVDESRQRRLQGPHLAQVDDTGLVAERAGGEARPGSRRADDEDHPVVVAEERTLPAGAHGDAHGRGAVRRHRPDLPDGMHETACLVHRNANYARPDVSRR